MPTSTMTPDQGRVPNVTITLAPDDHTTYLTVSDRTAGATDRVRVTFNPSQPSRPQSVATFDVAVFGPHGWVHVLTLDGNTADTIEEAAATAFHVLHRG